MIKRLLLISLYVGSAFADNTIINYGNFAGNNISQQDNNQQHIIEKQSIDNRITDFKNKYGRKIMDVSQKSNPVVESSDLEGIKAAEEINKLRLPKALKKQECSKFSFGGSFMKFDIKLAIGRCQSFFE